MLKKVLIVVTICLCQFLLPGSVSAAETYYTVKPGDSLWAIAMQNDISVEEIKQLNQLTSDNLPIGLKLCVANAAEQTASAETPAASGEITPEGNLYVIQPGDSLNSIAANFGTSVIMLKRINNLSTDVINPGYVLKTSLAGSGVSRGGSALDNSLAAVIINTAGQYLGTPYCYGGCGPGGFDCSGFVKYVYAQHGYDLNRTAASQYSQGVPVSKADLQPGDLVFFCCSSASIDHVGIYIGNNEFIHSSSPRSGGVIITGLGESYYSRSYTGAVRIIL